MKQPNLSDAARKALAYWPQIEYAAEARMNTADLWGLIKDAAAEIGLASPGVTIQGVNEVRAIATGIQSRARLLDRAGDSKRLGGEYVSLAPWSRTQAARKALPAYQVRFLHTVTVDGEERTEWRSTRFPGALPRTVGDLRALVEGDARELAKGYGHEHVGIDELQLLAI